MIYLHPTTVRRLDVRRRARAIEAAIDRKVINPLFAYTVASLAGVGLGFVFNIIKILMR